MTTETTQAERMMCHHKGFSHGAPALPDGGRTTTHSSIGTHANGAKPHEHHGIGAQDGGMTPSGEWNGRRYAIARRGANEMRHAAALYTYGDTPTGWISKDGAHDRELTHGAPSLGW